MNLQLQGIMILLCSILLTLIFAVTNTRSIGDTDVSWFLVWMITGILGLVWGFLPSKKDRNQ